MEILGRSAVLSVDPKIEEISVAFYHDALPMHKHSLVSLEAVNRHNIHTCMNASTISSLTVCKNLSQFSGVFWHRDVDDEKFDATVSPLLLFVVTKTRT
jgi:hypothetical protein